MRWIAQGVLILTLALTLVYGFASNFDFLFEDQAQLAAYPREPQAEDYRALWHRPTQVLTRTWRPVAHATLMAQRGVSGLDDAWPYRLLNVFLLGLAGVLACAVFKSPPLKFRRIPLILAMLGWVFHPVATGCVYRIVAGRELLLMMVFVLAALWLYFRNGFLYRGIALLCFVAALGSHEQAWVFPLLLGVAAVLKLPLIPSRRDEYRGANQGLSPLASGYEWKEWLWVAVFLIVLGGYAYVRRMALQGVAIEWHPERMPFRAFLYGLQATFLPFREVLHEPTWPVWWSGWRLFGALWVAMGVIALCVFCLYRSDLTPIWGRNEEKRRLAFLAAWFLLWSPPLAVLWTREPAFHEMSLWPFSLAAFGVLAWAGTRVWSETALRQEGWVLGVSLLIVLMAMSFYRRVEHRTDGDYVAHWSRRDPGAGRRLEAQVRALAEAGLWDEAELMTRRGLMLSPDDRVLMNLRREVLERKGRLEEALAVARELARQGEDADREKLADTLMRMRRFREASDLYTLLLEKHPDTPRLKEKLEQSLTGEREEESPGS